MKTSILKDKSKPSTEKYDKPVRNLRRGSVHWQHPEKLDAKSEDNIETVIIDTSLAKRSKDSSSFRAANRLLNRSQSISIPTANNVNLKYQKNSKVNRR